MLLADTWVRTFLHRQNLSFNVDAVILAGTRTVSPRCLRLRSLSLYALQAASAILTFILAMVQYPDVQERARAEINQVMKNEMIPSMVDRTSIPYIDAIIREVLRWYPPVPLGPSVVVLSSVCIIERLVQE